MKVLNTGEDIPEYFYIFIDRNAESLWNKCENHNIKLRDGRLLSSGFGNAICLQNEQREKFLNGDIIYAPYVPNQVTNVGNISPFLFRLVERYSLEYVLEWVRYNYYKEYPSRFSCIFAFGNFSDCVAFAKGKKNWKLKGLKKYRLLFDDEYNKYIKVIRTNFKLIGLLEKASISSYPRNAQEFFCRHYWEGKGALTLPEFKIGEDVFIADKRCGNLDEYLIEGILEEVKFTKEEKDKINLLTS